MLFTHCTQHFSQELAQTSDKQLEEVIAEEYQQLCKMQADLPNIQAPDEILKPLGRGGITVNDLNFTPLVEMHHRHQTRQAALGVQTRSSKSTDTESTLKQGIIQHMHNVLKEQDVHAVGTGCEHSAQ